MGRAGVVLGIVVIVFGLALAWSVLRPSPEPAAYPYSELMADAAAGRVTSIVQEGTELTVSLRDALVSVAGNALGAPQRARSSVSVRSATPRARPALRKGSCRC